MLGGKKRSPFIEEVVSHQRKLLKDNLIDLAVPVDEREKIMAMRERLPDYYHEMPLKVPSLCFWLLENQKVPSKTWRNSHIIDSFVKCEGEIRKAAAEEASPVEAPPPGLRR